MNHRLVMADIPKLSLIDAQYHIDILSEEAGKIDAELRTARAEQIATNTYADPVWFQASTNQMKQKRRLVMRLQQHVKGLKRQQWKTEYEANGKQSKISDNGYAQCFVTVAKTVLQPDTYLMIEESARAMCQR
jgi:hypothetical protein